jgi:hypothetical protein
VERTLVYTTNPLLSSMRVMDFRTVANICFNFLIFVFVIWSRKRLEFQYKYFNIFLNVYLLQMFIYFSLYEIVAVSERLKFFTWISNIILIPYFIVLFKSRTEKLLPYVVMIFYCFIFSSSYILERPATISYYPYQNYVVYKAFDIKSSGKQRLKEQEKVFASYE